MVRKDDEILEYLERYRKSVWEKNLDAFLEIYDKEVCVYDLWNVWSYDGIDAWKEMANGWFSWLKEDRDDVSFHDTVVNTSGELASLHTMVTYKGMSAEGLELRQIQNRMTWILQKKNGLWKIIHEHTSGPVSMDDMKLILKK
jgi:ketosteroid isomerase-like protein